MLLQTKTPAINSALLEEIKQLNRVLWDLVEDIAVACSCRLKTHEGCTFFCIRLTRLRDQLATHFSLEEAFGYFDGPIDIAPRLSDTADKLLQEHAQLQHRVSELVTFTWTLHNRGALHVAFTQVAREFDGFHNDLSQHERREQLLILQAYDDDIGVGE